MQTGFSNLVSINFFYHMYMITGMLLNPVRQGQCWDMYFKYYMKSLVSENFSIRVYSSLFHEIDGEFVLLEWTTNNKM